MPRLPRTWVAAALSLTLVSCAGSDGQTPTRLVEDVAALTDAINAGDIPAARGLLTELDQDIDAAIRQHTIGQDAARQVRTAADRLGERLAEVAPYAVRLRRGRRVQPHAGQRRARRPRVPNRPRTRRTSQKSPASPERTTRARTARASTAEPRHPRCLAAGAQPRR